MFKLHKPQLSGSIHSGHFMVSRLDDDDEDDNHDLADDSSESERDNANSVEIDVNNPDSVVGANNLDIKYGVESPTAKDEQLTSWNDLDKPTKNSQKQHQYLTYYSNSYVEDGSRAKSGPSATIQLTGASVSNSLTSMHNTGVISDRNAVNPNHETNKDLLSRGLNSNLNHLHEHHHLQDQSQHQQQQQLLPLNHQHHHHHHQHAVTIDTSLTKLLECMSLYYSSKLTSPKWKSFKGLKLRLKYKIRLNNLIWRAWFLQCIRGRRPPGCQFTAPVETDVHKKSETIVLEGKYWKRKEKAILDEYKKWRTFQKQKSQMNCFRPSSFDWDSRVSNLASSSMYPEYHFYPDYDMNITYNLDDLPPMLEDNETRETASYYPTQPSMRTIEPQLPIHYQQLHHQHHHHHQQQQQQQQQHHQLQQQQHVQQQNQQLQQQQQLAQLNVTSNSSNSQQALSLKQEQSLMATTNQQQHHFQPNFTQQIQYQQHAQSLQLQRQPVLSTSFDTSPLYQQLNEQLQQQLPRSISPPHSEQQQQQQQQQDIAMSINQDLYPLGGGMGSGRSEQRRVCHINAEQKRRCNIKNGFDTLKSILPSINQNVNVKISKASMLQKAALYISALSAEQKQQVDEQAMLKQQIEGLKQTISAYQSQLPASGGPVGCQGSNHAREMLQEYVRRRTLENWKFWIFSLLIEPLFETYYNSVSTTTLEESCKTIFTWLDRSCGLVSLRKEVLDSLTFLSTSTNILNTPQTLPTEAVDAVRYTSGPTTSGQATQSRQQQQIQTTHPSQQQQQQQQQQTSSYTRLM